MLHLEDSVLLWCTSVRDWVLRSYTNEGFLNARAFQRVRAVVYPLSLARAWKVEGGRVR